MVALFSSYPKCFYCNRQINTQQRPYFTHTLINIHKPCKAIFCIWCCYDKIYIEEKWVENNKQQVRVQCCKMNISSMIKKIKDFIQQNCILCGKNCKSKQQIYFLSVGKLHVGKQCYMQIKKPKYRSSQQKKTKQQISFRVKTLCIFCKKQQLNIFTESQQAKQLNLCTKCYQSSKQQSIKELELVKKCQFCHQPQIFEKHKNIFKLQFKEKKILSLRQFSIHLNNKKQLLCSFCLYLFYLGTQKFLQNNLTAHQIFFKLKKNYQEHFKQYCMVCGQGTESNHNVYPIISQNENIILSFICQTCKDHLKKSEEKYIRFPQIKRFLKETKQLQIEQKQISWSKKQFQSCADNCLKMIENNQRDLKQQKKYERRNQTSDKQNPLDKPDKDEVFQHLNNEQDQGGDGVNFRFNFKYKIETYTSKQDDIKIQTEQIKEQTNIKQELIPLILTQNLTQYQQLQQQYLSQNSNTEINPSCLSLKSYGLNQPQFIHELQFHINCFIQSNQQNKIQLPTAINTIKSQIKAQSCVFYATCHNRQLLLNLNQTICDQCFCKYLLGDQQITKELHQITSSKHYPIKPKKQYQISNTKSTIF